MNITLPDLGSPAVVSLWYVQSGERVFELDRVVEVLIPGATFDVASPATGILRDRFVQPNDPVAFGQILGEISTDEPRGLSSRS
ncbi:MAG TPA: lipoyl domain-containing protein [Urbifossiella sp.]|jgi:pyruvate/2-oxoglutarate dehydrogenase complex dihydrolipoamide acyltransferase (E2) component